MQIAISTLAALSTVEIEGTHVRITHQLERTLYVKVNTVLEALGGKWNRKAKAHVFPTDARSLLERAITAGEVTTNADLGFFETPLALAKQLVDLAEIEPTHVVLEPSAGAGRLVDEIQSHGAYVVAVEYDDARRAGLNLRRRMTHDWMTCVHVDHVADFMDFDPIEPFDRVVMNPPFCKVGKGDHIDHVRHAFEALVPGGVLVSVLPAGVQFRGDRRHTEFRAWCLEHATLIEPLPDDSFVESGTGVRTCVVKLVRR